MQFLFYLNYCSKQGFDWQAHLKFSLASFSWSCSSLSVFALHPLYLRVEALSENLPETIKVVSLAFHLILSNMILEDIFFIICWQFLANYFLSFQLKFYPLLFVVNTLPFLSFPFFFWQKEIQEAREQLDGKVVIFSDSSTS